MSRRRPWRWACRFIGHQEAHYELIVWHGFCRRCGLSLHGKFHDYMAGRQ